MAKKIKEYRVTGLFTHYPNHESERIGERVYLADEVDKVIETNARMASGVYEAQEERWQSKVAELRKRIKELGSKIQFGLREGLLEEIIDEIFGPEKANHNMGGNRKDDCVQNGGNSPSQGKPTASKSGNEKLAKKGVFKSPPPNLIFEEAKGSPLGAETSTLVPEKEQSVVDPPDSQEEKEDNRIKDGYELVQRINEKCLELQKESDE